MQKYRLIFCLILAMGFGSVNAQGIKFEEHINWKEILTKAKQEHKLIFVDCYASWCGPCKWMNENVFNQADVGEYFNDHFISVALQMDRTAGDDKNIRSAYSWAARLSKEFKIKAYPTYLFFDADGNAVHKVIGSTSKKSFLSVGKDAQSPEKQYFTIINNWQHHRADSTYLGRSIGILSRLNYTATITELGNAYFACLKQPFLRDNLEVLSKTIQSDKDPLFTLFLNNAVLIDSVTEFKFTTTNAIGKVVSARYIEPYFEKKEGSKSWATLRAQIIKAYPQMIPRIVNWFYGLYVGNIFDKEIKPIYTQDSVSPDWLMLSQKIAHTYPGFNPDSMLIVEKPAYYKKKKLWQECARTALELLHAYGEQLSARDLNNILWYDIFLNCSDKKILLEAVGWGNKLVAMNPADYNNIDTYANLLYKAGDLMEAIKMEKKVITMIEAQQRRNSKEYAEYKAILVKMQANEKTWDN